MSKINSENTEAPLSTAVKANIAKTGLCICIFGIPIYIFALWGYKSNYFAKSNYPLFYKNKNYLTDQSLLCGSLFLTVPLQLTIYKVALTVLACYSDTEDDNAANTDNTANTTMKNNQENTNTTNNDSILVPDNFSPHIRIIPTELISKIQKDDDGDDDEDDEDKDEDEDEDEDSVPSNLDPDDTNPDIQ